MAKGRCSNCGYKFTKDDGSICPECLTGREDFYKSDSLSDDIKNHKKINENDDNNYFKSGVSDKFLNSLKNAPKEERVEQLTRLIESFQKKSANGSADNINQIGKIIKGIIIFIILVNAIPIMIAFFKALYG
ncbi:MAG: hypothetical protein WC900_05660 [Oscillospiraceae bacterium]|jgi:uncharacterized Zn finger protein (UPF0148 family)